MSKRERHLTRRLEGDTGFNYNTNNTNQDCPSNGGEEGHALGLEGGARSAGGGVGAVGQAVSALDACAAFWERPQLRGGRTRENVTAEKIGQLTQAVRPRTNERTADSTAGGSRLSRGARNSAEKNLTTIGLDVQ